MKFVEKISFFLNYLVDAVVFYDRIGFFRVGVKR